MASVASDRWAKAGGKALAIKVLTEDTRKVGKYAPAAGGPPAPAPPSRGESEASTAPEEHISLPRIDARDEKFHKEVHPKSKTSQAEQQRGGEEPPTEQKAAAQVASDRWAKAGGKALAVKVLTEEISSNAAGGPPAVPPSRGDPPEQIQQRAAVASAGDPGALVSLQDPLKSRRLSRQGTIEARDQDELLAALDKVIGAAQSRMRDPDTAIAEPFERRGSSSASSADELKPLEQVQGVRVSERNRRRPSRRPANLATTASQCSIVPPPPETSSITLQTPFVIYDQNEVNRAMKRTLKLFASGLVKEQKIAAWERGFGRWLLQEWLRVAREGSGETCRKIADRTGKVLLGLAERKEETSQKEVEHRKVARELERLETKMRRAEGLHAKHRGDLLESLAEQVKIYF